MKGSLYLILATVMLFVFSSNQFQPKTRVSIEGDQWLINGEVINSGTPAEGLIMNVRMVNSVFEDRGVELKKRIPGFDPDNNTQRFIDRIPEYVQNGVNAFTISLQGGLPGYEGAVNTAFEPDGSLRDTYMGRVARVIEACDQNNAVVILSLFYQRQHSHSFALTGKEAIKNAVVNLALWIKQQGYQNVMLEISNEYRHGGFRSWPDGGWFTNEQGQVELIELAKQTFPELLVSTSGMGDGRFHEYLAQVSDFILIHFNNTALEDYGHKIAEVKRYGKPVICNEDHKVAEDGATALALSVLHGAGWGLMVIEVNQRAPFEFLGIDDDPMVYTMFKNVTSAGYQLADADFRISSIIITQPRDGDSFHVGDSVNLQFSHIITDIQLDYVVEFTANGVSIAILADDSTSHNFIFKEEGIYLFEVLVKTPNGHLLYQSPKVDVIVE